MGNAQRKETPSLDWTLGDRLGKSLKFAGVSAQEMADYLGVARNTVSNYLNDHTAPSKLARKEWAMRTGVPLSYIENGTMPEADPDGVGPDGLDPSTSTVESGQLAPVIDITSRKAS